MRRKQNFASALVFVCLFVCFTALGIQKENGGTMHFSDIIKLKYGKKTPYISLYFTAF